MTKEIQNYTDEELILEFKILSFSIDGEKFIGKLVSELHRRNLVNQDGSLKEDQKNA